MKETHTGQIQLRHTTERSGQELSYTMPAKQIDKTSESNFAYTVNANEHLHPHREHRKNTNTTQQRITAVVPGRPPDTLQEVSQNRLPSQV